MIAPCALPLTGRCCPGEPARKRVIRGRRRLADEAQLAGTTEASLAAEASARVLRGHIDEGEFRHVLDVLPSALLPLFH